MEVVKLGVSGSVVDTRLGRGHTEVAVGLDGVGRHSKVRVDGVCAGAGVGFLQLDVQAGAGWSLAVDLCQLALHGSQLHVHELLFVGIMRRK